MVRNANQEDFTKLKEIKPSLPLLTFKKRLEMQNKGYANFLILEKQGKPVCFALVKWLGKTTHPNFPDIEDLFTKESERRKGYGSLLVSECEKLAKKKGFRKIGLAVNPRLNPIAKNLYEHLGYRHDGKPAYVDGVYDGVEDWCVDMEKALV